MPPPYPSEVEAVTFSKAQLVKIDELLAKVVARAGKEAKKECAHLKQRIAETQAEIRRRINQLLHAVQPQPLRAAHRHEHIVAKDS
jgi:ElaB/YqjD/DUF883 family membrane-anchored ribosome-binding protein